MKRQEGSGVAKRGYWDLEQRCGRKWRADFSNFDSLKSTETIERCIDHVYRSYFSNFDSLKSTETGVEVGKKAVIEYFSNFDSLKSTETQA